MRSASLRLDLFQPSRKAPHSLQRTCLSSLLERSWSSFLSHCNELTRWLDLSTSAQLKQHPNPWRVMLIFIRFYRWGERITGRGYYFTLKGSHELGKLSMENGKCWYTCLILCSQQSSKPPSASSSPAQQSASSRHAEDVGAGQRSKDGLINRDYFGRSRHHALRVTLTYFLILNGIALIRSVGATLFGSFKRQSDHEPEKTRVI